MSLSPATRVFLALAPIDGRQGFNGLTALVKGTLAQEPTSGFLLVFINKARNRLKVLYWDGTGAWVLAKRLEKGRFSWPSSASGQSKLSLTPEAFALLVGGIELKDGLRKAWYER